MRVFCFLWILGSINLYAQEIPQTTLQDTVVVTASRVETPLGKTPAKGTIISQEEIMLSGAENISDLLSKKLPFYTKESPGFTGTLWIGGMKSEDSAPSVFGKVLILINGHPAGTGNLSHIPFTAIERIEVLEGPLSTLYGSGALSGVVNIITQKKQPQKNILANIALGSFSFQKAEVKADFFLPNIFYAVLQGGIESQKDYKIPGNHTYQNTGYNKQQAYAGFTVPLPTGFIEGSLAYLRAKDIGNPSTFATNDLDDYSEVDYFNLDTRWQHFWNSGELQVLGYINNNKALNVGLGPNAWDNWQFNQKLLETGLFTMVKQTFHFLEVKVGANGHGAFLSKQSETGSYNEPKTQSFTLGTFGEVAWEPLSNLIVSVGARYDFIALALKDSQGITFAGGKKNKNLNFASLRAGVSYLKDFWIFKVSGGNGFTAPNVLQLTGNYTGPWGDYQGNPHLDPEKSWALQASGGIMAQHSLLFSYHRQKINNRIASTPYEFGLPTTYINQKEVILENLGLEGKLVWQNKKSLWNASLNLRSVYYTQLKDKETKKNLPYLPRFKTTLGGFLSYHNLAFLSVEGVYTGTFTDGFSQKKLGKTFSCDVGLKALPFGFFLDQSHLNNLSIEFKILNLTNEKIVWVDGYPLPQRNYKISFEYNFPF